MYTKIIIKTSFAFFSLQYIKMSGRDINFDDKKIKKVSFTKTKKYIVLTALMLITY